MTNQGTSAARHRRTAVAATSVVTVAILLAGCLPPVGRGGSAGPSSASSESAGTSAATAAAVPPGPTPIPSFIRPTPTPAPTFLVHVVVAGDSLNTIAHRYGTTARSIAYWNRAAYPTLDPDAPGYRPGVIRIGWSLILIPNVVVDEQTLPEPTPNPTDPSDAEPSDTGPEPGDSAPPP